MKRIKEIFGNLKEAWKVPRYKGLMKLAFWFIFFGLIFLILKFGGHEKYVDTEDNTNTDEIIEKESTEKLNSYSYNCQINDGVNIVNISGTYYNGIDEFDYNNMHYYLKDNKYYVDNQETTFNIFMNEFEYNNILELVKAKEYESKTEYKDGSIEELYSIDALTYNSFYHKNYQTLGNALIKIKKLNSLIISIDLDLSSYYNEYSSYRVIINYSNYNNITK